MKKMNVLLCSVAAAFVMTGCGEMPELTQEESELISEYAVGVLLKYDTAYNNRLVDTPADDPAEEETELPEEENPEEEPEPEMEEPAEVVDVSQDEEEAQPMVSSVEEYYGIPNVMISYTGYELTDSYPPSEEGEVPDFSMEVSRTEHKRTRPADEYAGIWRYISCFCEWGGQQGSPCDNAGE